MKSLHITLAYHFDVSFYEELKALVEDMHPMEHSNWELRLYSRDPRFANHQVNNSILLFYFVRVKEIVIES